ncbi:TPA: hypothetical protein KE234_000511 [Citrobacter koseri]|uniref:hypothetical protein n=1 Tax=Citrobacter koseri TaxID=545 RepID=UPI001B9E34B1|nr:hypothetical protein [Citrobacter koseri]HBC7342184.1 hypothetical protein [Citrobacter koseri]HBC8644010.1 hypothetical protein [Citrobacter koseri]
MTFYHASTNQYQIGDLIIHTPGNICVYYPEVNVELDRVKPQDMLGRDSAIYITNDCAFAKYFISTQHSNSPTFVYEVSTTDILNEHPFAVVHQIDQSIKTSKTSKVSALSAEYWQPNQKWNFYEYLVSSITIIDIMHVDDFDIMLAKNPYFQDVDKAKSI